MARGPSRAPLMNNDNDKSEYRGRRTSPALPSMESSFHTTRSARSVQTLRSLSPTYAEPENLTRRKYYYASFFLVVSLISFVVQTETAVYIQHELHWDKAYCMLWLTHGSWIFLWPIQFAILRIQKRKITFDNFWRRHYEILRSTAQLIQQSQQKVSASSNPWVYMAKTTAFITTFLTVAGGSWYVAVNLTSPSDLTAIYNCSAFFAYVFSIWLLGDKLRLDKMISVFLAIVGVLVVAYGDSEEPKHGSHSGGSTNPDQDPDTLSGKSKLFGNLIIGVGSVMYGLYEVLYKKYACPPDNAGVSPSRGMIFANTFGSMIGLFTLTVLWIPLPFLHFTGIERFELPRGKAAMLLSVSTLSNAVFSGSFLVLMSLTSPVLSSVAALLTIFLVAVTDWLITGKPLSGAAMLGGALIIVAFIMLSWATYREMSEEADKRAKEDEGKFVGEEEELMMGRDGEDVEGAEDELGRGRRRRSDDF